MKTIDPEYLYNSGTEIILSNTYHLYLRPGQDLINQAAGCIILWVGTNRF